VIMGIFDRTIEKSKFSLDVTSRFGQVLVVESIRVVFLSAILLITVALNVHQPHFVNFDLLSSVYGILAVGFLVHFVYILFFEYTFKFWFVSGGIFALDTLLYTSIVYNTGVSQSIFLFLFLVNIVLCGFIFRTRGALLLALWTSIFFSILILTGREELGQRVIYILGLNNLAFLSVALLSGVLSDQINFMGIELKEKGRSLKILEDYNKLVVENISTGLLTVNLSGDILHHNPLLLVLLNRREDVLGKNITTLFPHFSEYIRPNQKGEPLIRENLLPRRRILHIKDNLSEPRVFELISSSLRNTMGESFGFILLVQDLTEISRLEKDVRQAEKMAAIGQLAAGIAHEIRNPLASISGSVELLFSMLEQQTSDERKLMAIVMKEIKRLNGLITEFLDFVRPDAPLDRAVNLNDVIQSVIDLVQMNSQVSKGTIKSQLELKAKKTILGNYDKLKQAFLNVIINGYEAMEEKTEGRLYVTTFDRGDSVEVHIRDEGMGMSESSKSKMFEPFHTTKKRGTGLGLAVTHKILEMHSAKVRVESELDRGTVFIMEFPANHQMMAQTSTIDNKLKIENQVESNIAKKKVKGV